MAELENLTPETRVKGVIPDRPVTVVQTSWHGTAGITHYPPEPALPPSPEAIYQSLRRRKERLEAWRGKTPQARSRRRAGAAGPIPALSGEDIEGARGRA